jgi:chaperonin GroES
MFTPLEDRIILKAEKDEDQVSTSGLILTGTKENTNVAEVIAVGPGRVLPSGIRLEPDVAVGDRVAYTPMAVQKFEHNGEEYMTIFSRDVLAIV